MRRQEFTAEVWGDFSSTVWRNSLLPKALDDYQALRQGVARSLQASVKRKPYLSMRDIPVHFYSFLQKIGCTASQDLGAIVKYFSLSSYELFKLTFKRHLGTASPDSSPEFWGCWTGLHWPLKVKPILKGKILDKKEREIWSKSGKKKLSEKQQPRDFLL